MPFLIAVIFIVALRLGIWKLAPAMEFAIKDELSNMIIASFIFGLALLFFGWKYWRRQGLVKSGIEAPLALFIFSAAVSLGWTADTCSSVNAILMLLAYVFFFYMLLDVLAHAQARRIFLGFFLLAAAVVGAVGINDIIYLNGISPAVVESARKTNDSLYYILTHKRACSLLGWPNVLAGFLMLGMPLAAAFLMIVRHWAYKVMVIAGAALMLAAFFFTYSFLGWTVFLLTSVFMFIVLWRAGYLKVSALIGRYLAGVVVLAAILFAVVIVKKDFASSMTPRKEYARVVRSTILEHPWRGGGYGAYRFASSKFINNHEGMSAYAHNSYLQIWAEMGLPGFMAIIWMVILLAILAVRALGRVKEGEDRILLITVLWSMLAFLIDNMNSFTMLKPNASFFFWMWLAVVGSYVQPAQDAIVSKWKGRSILMVALMGACIAGLFLSGRSAASLNAFRIGNETISAGKFDPARAALEKACLLNPMDPKSLTLLGSIYLRVFKETGQAPWLEQAKRTFGRARQLAPNAYYNHLALSYIYTVRGDRVRAEFSKQRAMAVSPYETMRDLGQFAGR